MPISSVFRQSFPKPFHGPSRKNRPRHGHIRAVSVASFASTSSLGSIVVISVTATESNNNGNGNNPRTNESNSNTDASLCRATRAAFGAPTPLDDMIMGSVHLAGSSNMNVMQGTVGKDRGGPGKPSSSRSSSISSSSSSSSSGSGDDDDEDGRAGSPITNLSTPTSASFSPSLLSPHFHSPSCASCPSCPSTPITPFLAPDTFLSPLCSPLSSLSSSPHPPPLFSATDLALLSPTMPAGGALGKRFGSFFSNHGSKGDSDDQVASLKVNKGQSAAESDKQNRLLKKKRLSAPIGTFLSHAFRPKQQQPQDQQHQQHPQQQEQLHSIDPPKGKKRRNLLPKLPRLDTRPKITVSAETTTAGTTSFPSGGPVRRRFAKATFRKTKESKERGIVTSLAQRESEERATPGTDDEGGDFVIVPSNPDAVDLLSPFYLPAQLRPGTSPALSMQLGSTSESQPSLPSPTEEEFRDWRRYSEVYYDDRWDRASVRTVDSETLRLSADDPNFPGYPERNDFWQQNCRIRERRWKQQLQKHQQQQQTVARSPASWVSRARGNTEEETDSIAEEDVVDGELSERLQIATLNLDSISTDLTDPSLSTLETQSRGRQQRVRYTSYSAYAAAMQLKSKSRTDRKQSANAFISGVVGGDDHTTTASARLLQDVRGLQVKSMGQNQVGPMTDRPKEAVSKGTGVGSGDDEMTGISARRRRQPDSGILFVASTATTAEVYPALHHDPQALLGKNFRSDFKKDICASNDTIHGLGVLSEDELMIGCLVASYFDKRVFKRVESEYHGKLKHKGPDMDVFPQKEELIDDANEDDLVGNGFTMLQSSFGDHGSLDALSGRSSTPPNPVYPSCTPSTAFNSCTTSTTTIPKNTINNNYISNKAAVDLCLSQPGQYASHNHILPLHLLLEQEEQERQRQRRQKLDRQGSDPAQALDGHDVTHDKNFSSSSDDSTSTSRSDTPPSHLLFGSVASSSTSPSTSPTLPKHGFFETSVLPQDEVGTSSSVGISTNNNGHMLLMLCDGRFQYYKNGTRKRGLQWEDDYDMVDGTEDSAGFFHETNMIPEEDEEDYSDREHHESQEEASLVKGKGVDRSLYQTEDQVEDRPPEEREESDVKGPITNTAGHSNAPSTSYRSKFLSTNTLPRTASTSSYTSPPPRSAASSNRLATLGSVRGAKSRPSVSYSVLPTLASVTTPASLSSLATANDSSTLLSSSSSQLTHYLRHQGSSGAMTTRTTTTFNSSSTAVDTPTTGLSWSNIAQFPTSASALLSDTLAKPAMVAFLQSQQQKRDNETPAQRILSLSKSAHNALDGAVANADRSLNSEAAVLAATQFPSGLLSLPGSATSSLSLAPGSSPKEWLRRAFPQRQRSASSAMSSPASSPAQRSTVALTAKTSTLLAAAAATKDFLETRMADEEMEQELWETLEDDDLQEDEPLLNRADSKGSKDGGSRSPTTLLRRADQSFSRLHGTRTKHQPRALSMVELSTSKPSPKTTRQLCKSNALTSTSTVVTLESSHGLYQWNEFFDM